ncbi:hypothetical protein RPHASCH2410_CH00625 [Rhizobium phaseoli Ch24-10]|nr:hypothetical protein RPHASCH2410_CH00625 [Rhizobium phaseoli Ch24-10]
MMLSASDLCVDQSNVRPILDTHYSSHIPGACHWRFPIASKRGRSCAIHSDSYPTGETGRRYEAHRRIARRARTASILSNLSRTGVVGANNPSRTGNWRAIPSRFVRSFEFHESCHQQISLDSRRIWINDTR